MFGYIKPFKPELKICEFDAYKAVYCGLCGQLGKSYGCMARLTLSYDFTFLSMLHSAVSQKTPEVEFARCYVNPLKKTPRIKDSESLQFAADAAAIMLYYKLIDNIEDSSAFGKIGWSALRPLIAPAHNKAAKTNPDADGIIRESLERQAVVETKGSDSIDEAAEPTADAMSKLFGLLTPDDKTGRVLSRLGYCIGRFSYICDALDDIEDDIKRGRYNPLVLRYGLENAGEDKLKAAREAASESVYMTIGEAAKAYDLLRINVFKPVLDNIIGLGLRHTCDMLAGGIKRDKTGFNMKPV